MNIGFLIYDELQALDISGPMDVFAGANARAARAGYRLITIGIDDKPVRAENGLVLVPAHTLADAPPLDTLVIPGGSGSRTLNDDDKLLAWLRECASGARRVVSVCTGIYILAATGLLDGRRATTHWRFADEVQARYPDVRLDVDQLYVRDGKFFTSGGLTAGMDLALSLVEEDLGAGVALAVARDLVMYMKRPGNQAQFSAPLAAQQRGGGRLAPLVEWMLAHLHEEISVDRLAEQAAMSPRNFRRVFRETFGAAPARYLERLRLEQACVLLTSGTDSVERIAATVGFASADVFRRAFRTRYETSPLAYRQRFARDDRPESSGS